MVQVYTNRNTDFGAWIRDDAFDHKLGNRDNIDWEEFQSNAPRHEFDLKRFFSWQRYSEYGTSLTGNDLSHQYDCMNQILHLGIPETVVALGGQYYYKHKVSQDSKILSLFRFVTFFGILMLLINPGFIQNSTEIIKPNLMLAVDNDQDLQQKID